MSSIRENHQPASKQRGKGLCLTPIARAAHHFAPSPPWSTGLCSAGPSSHNYSSWGTSRSPKDSWVS